MVVLATVATVIASQAVITGAYSLTSQAIQLGLLPRFEIRHTSAQQAGQIYMPRVNGLLLVGVLLLVALFRSSSALASAYGIAVTGTMVVTGMMAFVVIWRIWQWSVLAAAALILPFLVIDLTFLSANMLKVIEGGWVPLALGGVIMLVMYTWRRGSRLLFDKTRRLETPLDDLVRMLERKPPQRVPGTAVFLTSDPKSAPTALLHSLKHYSVLHDKNIILSVETTHTPRVEQSKRVHIEPVGSTFMRVLLRFGYMETPNIPKALGVARKLGCNSTSCRPRFSCRAARCGRRRDRACRAGRTVCSSRWRAPPMMPPTISRYRPTGSSRSARRSPSEALGIAIGGFSNARGPRRKKLLDSARR